MNKRYIYIMTNNDRETYNVIGAIENAFLRKGMSSIKSSKTIGYFETNGMVVNADHVSNSNSENKVHSIADHVFNLRTVANLETRQNFVDAIVYFVYNTWEKENRKKEINDDFADILSAVLKKAGDRKVNIFVGEKGELSITIGGT